ncbi:hypothetical protein CEXT_529541 [Caerostris extrusa]|uniref:Uncharacterized protein n=1 Tax=Caerostris extrusa TaxID=172846 RepID=A0AAV4SAV0_CAEEX|nr:hypothetical protein CEXT_529541 [Caerostris extrusa]
MVKEEGNQCAGMGEFSSIGRNQCAVMTDFPGLFQWDTFWQLGGFTSLEERELILLMKIDFLFIRVARQVFVARMRLIQPEELESMPIQFPTSISLNSSNGVNHEKLYGDTGRYLIANKFCRAFPWRDRVRFKAAVCSAYTIGPVSLPPTISLPSFGKFLSYSKEGSSEISFEESTLVLKS